MGVKPRPSSHLGLFLVFVTFEAMSPLPVQTKFFDDPAVIATIMDYIDDLTTMLSFTVVWPTAKTVVQQYPRSAMMNALRDIPYTFAEEPLHVAFLASMECHKASEADLEGILHDNHLGNPSRRSSPPMRISRPIEILERLPIVMAEIEGFGRFIKGPFRMPSGQPPFTWIPLRTGLSGYLPKLRYPHYHYIYWDGSSNHFMVERALWYLENYNELFHNGGSAAYRSSIACLIDQYRFLESLEGSRLSTMHSVISFLRCVLRRSSSYKNLSETLHYGDERFPVGPKFEFRHWVLTGIGEKYTKHLAYQLSLSLPVLLRVLHHGCSTGSWENVPHTSLLDTQHLSPAEIHEQRVEQRIKLWGFDPYEKTEGKDDTETMPLAPLPSCRDPKAAAVRSWVPFAGSMRKRKHGNQQGRVTP